MLLITLASFCAIVLGGDIFLLKALRKQVDEFHRENKRLERQNDDFEAKLKQLSQVTGDLREVELKLGEGVEAVQALIQELEQFTSIQTASSMLNLFFAADVNGSRHIPGHAADILLHGLMPLWRLLPDYAPSQPNHRRLLAAVRKEGLALPRFAALAAAAADGDSAACRAELEALQRGGVGGEGDSLHLCDAGALGGGLSASEDSATEEEVAARFSFGPVRIYGWSHAAFICASVLAFVLLVLALLPPDPAEFVCAALDMVLAGGLTVYAKSVVNVRALRGEARRLGAENEKLAASNEDLGQKVRDLTKLQQGLKMLQAQFGSCAARARSVIRRSNASVKMSVISAVVHLFAQADTNSSGSLEDNEVDDFVSGLEIIFRRTEAFNADEIRSNIRQHGLHAGQVRDLVERLLVPNDRRPPLPK